MKKMESKIVKKITSSLLLCTIIAYTAPVFAFTKEETVYSKLNSDGSVYNTIVNDHIKNSEQNKIIDDISDLLNIENTNGDEELKKDGNKLVWSAEGSDIYYQGESQKELPIECNIKYELDGKEILAKDLAGKSGKVKISIEYINKDKHIVNINGKNEKMFTPFVVVCGTIIKNENNKNIEITNGKLVDDGTKTTVIGISLPGLKESLNISTDKIDIPNTIEITMDSTDFELNNIVSYVTPKIIDKNDLDIFNEIDQIYSKVDELQSSSKKIEVGANDLNNGVQTLNNSVGELNNGANQISNGQSQITSGLNQIQNRLPSTEEMNVNKTQLNTLSEGNKYAKQKLSDQVKNANTQVSELQNQLANVNTKLNAIKSGLSAGKISVSEEMTDAQLDGIINQINYKISEIDTQISQLTVQITEVEEIESIKMLAMSLKTAEEGKVSYQKAVDNINIYKSLLGTKRLITANIQSLSDLGNTINGTDTIPGLTKLIESNETVVQSSLKTIDSMNSLSNGVKELVKGSNQLQNGAVKLSGGTKQLVNGTEQLASGSKELANGISKFNKEGINKICDFINGDIKEISVRLEKLQELVEQYNNFTMLNDGNEGNVKFIMIIDGIQKEENNKEDAILEDKKETN